MDDKLKQIKMENYIWIIYIGIIVLSYISNYYEKRYYLFSDLLSKKKYHDLLVIIFLILVFIYIYFFNGALNDLINLSYSDSKNKKRFVKLSFLGSLFVLLSGFIFLYIAIKDENIDVEIAFN